MSSKTNNFYSNLEYLENFQEISNFKKYTSFPEDWYAILTDVKGSTKAVSEGKYKDVNFVGAAVIIALENLAIDHNLPFVFGGDGATLFIPPDLYEETRLTLANTQNLAQKSYGLELRCMIFPVSDLDENNKVSVAKLKISNLYTQAMLAGSGVDFLENTLKSDDTKYHIHPDFNLEPNFSGLECRWQDVPSKHGEIVTLIVKSKQELGQMEIYSEVLACIAQVYGNSDDFNPISKENIKLSLDFNQLGLEAKLFTFGKGIITRIRKQTWFWLVNLYGVLTSKNNKIVNDIKNSIALASDFKKFDGALKMVIAGNVQQRTMLLELLENMTDRNLIWYGYHISDRATLTCLVYANGNSEVHFVDGADGGYTLAAKMLKEKVRGG